jgi:hypothetical protein
MIKRRYLFKLLLLNQLTMKTLKTPITTNV